MKLLDDFITDRTADPRWYHHLLDIATGMALFMVAGAMVLCVLLPLAVIAVIGLAGIGLLRMFYQGLRWLSVWLWQKICQTILARRPHPVG